MPLVQVMDCHALHPQLLFRSLLQSERLSTYADRTHGEEDRNGEDRMTEGMLQQFHLTMPCILVGVSGIIIGLAISAAVFFIVVARMPDNEHDT